MYNLPTRIKFCKKCTISNQRPRITFDENRVCSACNFAEHKKTIDWKLREQELHELCDKHRKNDGSNDVVVPCSGGKDGSCLDDIQAGEYFYFVHSFMVVPEKKEYLIAQCEDEGLLVAAAIKRDNITGLQFHPEKKGQGWLENII